MHAFVNPQEWNFFHNIVDEGELYLLQNFQVVEVTGNLRPVTTAMLILFTPSTIMNHAILDLPHIPMHKFELVPFGDVIHPSKSSPPDQTPTFSIGD